MRSRAGLWNWVVAAYAEPGVEATCLLLQDEYGQCVSYLLWAAWAAAGGRKVDAACLAKAADFARAWEAKVLAPLRAIRRGLRGVEAGGPADLRDQIKTEELAAERRLLKALAALTPARGGAPLDIGNALRAAAAAWGPAPPAEALDKLARAFSNA